MFTTFPGFETTIFGDFIVNRGFGEGISLITYTLKYKRKCIMNKNKRESYFTWWRTWKIEKKKNEIRPRKVRHRVARTNERMKPFLNAQTTVNIALWTKNLPNPVTFLYPYFPPDSSVPQTTSRSPQKTFKDSNYVYLTIEVTNRWRISAAIITVFHWIVTFSIRDNFHRDARKNPVTQVALWSLLLERVMKTVTINFQICQ